MKIKLIIPSVMAVIVGLLMSAVVLAQNPPAVVSPQILVAEAMTGGTVSAQQEFIEIINQTDSLVELEKVRLEYLSATGTEWSVKARLSGQLLPFGRVTVATSQYPVEKAQTLTAGLAATGGHIRIMYLDGQVDTETDKVGWGTALSPESAPAPAPAAGQSLKRITDENGQLLDRHDNSTDFLISDNPTPRTTNSDISQYCLASTPTTETDPVTDSDPPTDSGTIDESLAEAEQLPAVDPISYAPLLITELLIDPVSPATDAADEYVELFNPNGFSVDIASYTLQSGSSFQYSYQFPSYSLATEEYLAVFSLDSKLALSNSGGSVQLLDPAGASIDAVLAYPKAKVGQVWARRTDGIWQWSSQATPHQANRFDIVGEAAVANALIKRLVSQPAVGTASQSGSTSGSTTTTSATTAVATAPADNSVLVVTGLMALLYALYEYRQDIVNFVRKRRTDYLHWFRNRSKAKGR